MNNFVVKSLIILGLLAVGVSTGYFGYKNLNNRVSQFSPSQIDTGFIRSMVLHHKQAVLMGQLLLDGRPTELTALAKNITYSQLYELGSMEGWLNLWGRPLNVPVVDMSWMLLGERPADEVLLQYLIDCKNSPNGMSGLASLEQISELRNLEGQARDEHFLRLMLAHHEGGLPMAQFAAANAKLAVVKKLAQNVVIDQSNEINRIKITLGALEAFDSGG